MVLTCTLVYTICSCTRSVYVQLDFSVYQDCKFLAEHFLSVINLRTKNFPTKNIHYPKLPLSPG